MTTPIASLPEISENQANKAITHNLALRRIEINFGAVVSRSLTAPPISPTEGALYIPATGASGAWTGHENQILQWVNGGWLIYAPFPYQRLRSIADDADIIYKDSAWQVVAGGGDMSRAVYDADDDGIVDVATSIDGEPTAGQYYGTPSGGTTKGFYDLPSAGGGDMLKSDYDSDDDGIVNAAEEIAGTAGNNQYYGTNPSGVKGFYNLPTFSGGSGGIGDMLKSTYDTTNNGKVDLAENAEQLNGQLASFYLNRANHTGNIPAANVTGLPTVEETSGFIQTAANFDYPISASAVFGFTITSLFIKSSTGTCTAQLRINGTAVTGISSVAVSSSGTTANATGANTVSAGNRISLNISANSSAQNIEFTIAMQRTI